ncbi:MAG: hypothetical protein JWN32_3467 [Solirubrobacterales bacterium]|jgi:hypothetical protein|nr:hypothetical protein [Solirubrobacterales bacterium]
MKILHRARGALAVAVALAALFALAASASAYTAGPGFAASDFATNFPNNGSGGPIGIAFAGTDFLAVDSANGDLDRFPPGGGDAATHILRSVAYPGSGGLAVLNGHAYLALWSNGLGIAVLDPSTGAETSRILPGQRFLSLAINPADGRLYGNTYGDRVYRLDGLDTPTQTAVPYATSLAGGGSFDGIAFGPDGTLYGSTSISTWKIPPGGGTPVHVADVSTGDGIAYAPGDAITAPFLAVNANNGTIVKVDLTTGATSPILTGGSRGDFVTVGPDRCLYATQTDRVIKVTKADGTCQFVPPPPPANDRIVADPIVLHILPGLRINLGSLRATLLGGSPEHGIAGKTITFTGGGRTLCTATTNASGVAQCGNLLTSVSAVLGLRYTASFAGDASWRPASGVGKLLLIGGLGLL